MYNLTKEDFRNILKTLELQIRKADGNYFGLLSVSTRLTNYYFTHFCPMSKNHTLEDDNYLIKLANIVNIDLAHWLAKNYHYLLEQTEEHKECGELFNFQEAIKKAKRYLKA